MVEFKVNTWMKYGFTDVCIDAMALFMRQLSGNEMGWFSSRSASMLLRAAVQGKCKGLMTKDLVNMLRGGKVWTVVIDGHWILLCMAAQDEIISIASWNGEGDDSVDELRSLAGAIKAEMGLSGQVLTFERVYDEKVSLHVWNGGPTSPGQRVECLGGSLTR